MNLNRLCYMLPADIGEVVAPSDNGCEKQLSAEKQLSLGHHLGELFRRLCCCCCRPRRLDRIGSLCGHVAEKPHHHHQQQHDKYGGAEKHVQFQDMAGIMTKEKLFQGNPRIFNYAELYIGSNGFSENELLGSGGFGRVYRALLPSDGTVVAVKCIADKGERFEKTFAAELVAMAQLRHRNLVRLRGWCMHDEQLLLVYDYMPNRSLDRILFRRPDSSSPPLNWKRRQRIVNGLAAALFYLHEQLETQIIHRDVKTSNVMLDSQYNARLGDFGLARWLEHEIEFPRSTSSSVSMRTPSIKNYQFRLGDTTRIGGTIGYLPPESFRKRSTTAKSDVFSFGIVVLEVASGRRAVDLTFPDDQIVLLDWVRRLADEGKFLQAGDSRLPDGSYNLGDMQHLLHLGLLCSLNDPQSRPTMKWVMEALSSHFTGELPALPSFQALPRYISLSSPTPTATTTSTDATSSSGYITAAGTTMFITAAADADDDSSRDGAASDECNQHRATNFLSVDTPREIPFKEIIAATNNFSEAQMVAEMDFGTAYQGWLNNDLHVLVKRLGMKTCPALRARFSNELQNLGNLRHRHLVQLRGWCTEQGEMLVVYDYLSHRSLGLYLFHHPHPSKIGHPLLPWCHRNNIIRSIASAILYLHEQWDEQVIHRNITSSAIFLDSDMNPRLGSFALAEFLTRNTHGHHTVSSPSASARGIFGYMSPEYIESGKATTAADVYSFGVVILEVVSGRKAVDFRCPEVLLVEKIRELESRDRPLAELVDWKLDGDYDCEELERMVRLGLACTHSDPERRPTMRQIVSILDRKDSCLNPLISQKQWKERREEWEWKNATSLSLIKRIQALGIY